MDSSFLLALSRCNRIHVYNGNTVITILDTLHNRSECFSDSSLYLSSKGYFVFALPHNIIIFKIRNVRNYLES